MKTIKKALIFSVFLGIFLCFPKESFGQYYNPAYNGGTYINDMIRSRMNARRAAARKAEARKNAGSRKATKAASKKLHYRRAKKRS